MEETRVFRHRRTRALDPETGQGDAHVAFAFAAHRAVCDVDTELGLVRVVEIATTQDVGRAINPQAVEGQIQGGIAQGLGLALMEEIRMGDGRVLNASFTDYLLPTGLDMPPVRMEILETPHPDAPYGLNGVGEPPAIASTPAIVAALRAATGPAPAPDPRAPRRHRRRVSGLDELNRLGREEFADRLGGVAEGSPWVAERAWAEGPFADVEALADAFRRAINSASREWQLGLIRAHPDLAGRFALSPDSAAEQASAGLDRLTPERPGRVHPPERRLPRALRVPVRDLRARARHGVDPGRLPRAPGPRGHRRAAHGPGRDRQDRAAAVG